MFYVWVVKVEVLEQWVFQNFFLWFYFGNWGIYQYQMGYVLWLFGYEGECDYVVDVVGDYIYLVDVQCIQYCCYIVFLVFFVVVFVWMCGQFYVVKVWYDYGVVFGYCYSEWLLYVVCFVVVMQYDYCWVVFVDVYVDLGFVGVDCFGFEVGWVWFDCGNVG